MSLCRPARCGCSFRSDTLDIAHLGEGLIDIELASASYTESPDTRPSGSDRKLGMRVYTVDTQREFIWTGVWEIVSEPPQTWSVVMSQSVAVSVSMAYGRYQRSRNGAMMTAVFTITSSGTSGQPILINYPFTLAHAHASGGDFRYVDAGNTVYAGSISSNTTTQFHLQSDDNNAPLGSSPSFQVVNGDTVQLSATIWY